MADLVAKFFEEDLTEAELDALGGMLASSEDAALRFGGRAEAAYLRFDLPQPPVTSPVALLSSTVGWVALGFLIVSSGLWWVCRNWEGTRAVPVPQPATIEPELPSNRPEAPIREAAPSKVLQVPAVRQAAPMVKPEQPQPVVEEAASKSYPLLKVVVAQKSAGPVVVRVLSPEGQEVRRLYDGELSAGEWAFKWDGRMTDGNRVDPGRYIIETDYGYDRKTQEVLVK